jgi:molybdopterin molybdotransferase
MISVGEGKKLIQETISNENTIEIEISNAVGYALANDIFAPIHFPSFRQSAMDGYAICYEDFLLSKTFIVQDEIQAGDNSTILLEKGKAIRIFTGAKVPDGADTVVQQEATEEISTIKNPNSKTINIQLATFNSNIRSVGSQCKHNDLILKKGTTLQAGTISLLANLGIEKMNVFEKPRICILNTGKELLKLGEPLQDGKVFESNSFSLVHVLKQMHLNITEINWVDDDLEKTKKAVESSLSQCEFLLITGGVSVGDYDFVLESLQHNNVEIIFHKLKQKPGKPLLFGKQENKYIFGLPGNPASVLTCFYQYVYPALRQYIGFSAVDLLKIKLPLQNSYSKKAGLTHFLKAIVHEDSVEILDHQESYKMNSFAVANALVEIDAEKELVEKGELVKVYVLPN